jgi:hypothetical protein
VIERRRHSSTLDVRSFSGAYCDTDHQHLVVAKVRARLAVRKQTTHIFHMQRFNLKKLNEVKYKEQRETIRENIKISAKDSLDYYELKKHKPWFDEGC